MNPIDWKRKLSSRKLWAAIAGVITGLAMVFKLDESTISSVAGAVVSVASVVSYIVTEGKVDAGRRIGPSIQKRPARAVARVRRERTRTSKRRADTPRASVKETW